MGWQPNYQAEGQIYAKYVLKNVPDAKVGILYQNDDYGKDYLKGFEDGLGDRAKQLIVMRQSYEVTDPTVDSQIVNLKTSGANVFFNITTPKFAVQAIKKSHDIGWKPVHLLNNVSTSLAAVMNPAGTEASGPRDRALHEGGHRSAWQGDKGFGDWVADEGIPGGQARRPVQRLRLQRGEDARARVELAATTVAGEHHAPGGRDRGPRAADAAARSGSTRTPPISPRSSRRGSLR
jgi:hypothetical protein